MIGCYVTGILPRPKELIQVTRAYVRGRINADKLERAFEDAASKIINAQASAEFTYINDGMLKWQDLLRPFANGLGGVKTGSLARWFNNNTFYRTPIIIGEVSRKKNVVEEIIHVDFLPAFWSWKAILPGPYTFVQLSEDRFYKDETELMFEYARILREEVKSLAELGFEYVQLSDPALVYHPTGMSMSRGELDDICEALQVAVKGTSVKTCLQTFFGDFSQILPEALDFPVDHLGIDLYATDTEELKKYSFGKGVALGLVDSRNSLVEEPNELASIGKEIIESIYPSKINDVFICPNCDLEFLPWKRAEEKIQIISSVANRLEEELP